MSKFERPLRSIDDSKTEQVHLLRYEDINGENRLFGGQLISWIDEVATTVAKRHTGMKVTTACIDNLQFKHPAFLDDLIVIIGYLTYVGNTSLEVRVDTYLETLDGVRKPINRAYLTMVALNKEGKSAPIPYGLKIESESQKYEWDSAVKRIEFRKLRQQEGF